MAKRSKNKFFIKPGKLHPAIERLFAYCNRADIIRAANCYALIMLPHWKTYYDFTEPGHLSGGFSYSDFKTILGDVMSRKSELHYGLLLDGHTPVSLEETKTIAGNRRVFAGMVINDGMHFFLRTRFKHEGKHVWIHKDGSRPVTYAEGTQAVITDIEKALDEHVKARRDPTKPNDTSVIGYFVYPKGADMARGGRPPRFQDAAVKDMAEIYQAYLDIVQQRIQSSGNDQADVPNLLWTRRASMLAALSEELNSLGLAQHPLMADVMKRIAAFNQPQRAVAAETDVKTDKKPQP